ncbi:RloB family protein [Pseudomonas silesiensis]|uniref:RloB family protein n=1 Tax=Pseudomonas silesiensis TaxID=1853130 RepID=UPI0034D52085
MGSDNLHHKRKAKKAKDVARGKALRQRYEKVLIVSEGSKTEPHYFTEIKDHYEIDTANIRISGKCGSAPISVVNHGTELYAEEIAKGLEPYDKVYCVFDRDTHDSFDEAVLKIKGMKPRGIYHAITSVPCFEVWLLLHFNYSAAPFRASGNKSAGARVMDELLRYWPTYKKGQNNAFEHLFNELDSAIHSANRLNAECKSRGSDNPTTNIHDLVLYLKDIKAN